MKGGKKDKDKDLTTLHYQKSIGSIDLYINHDNYF